MASNSNSNYSSSRRRGSHSSLRESKNTRAQRVQASSSSSRAKGNTDDGKKNRKEMLKAQILEATTTPPSAPHRNNEISVDRVMIGGPSREMQSRSHDFMHALSLNDDIINNICNRRRSILLHTVPVQNPPQPQSPRQTTDDDVAADDRVNNMNNNNVVFYDDDEGDGRIHSLPHKKNGPYTCPRCNKVCSTSQGFAAHVAGHYNDETEAQRKKRLMSRSRNRNLRFQMVNDTLTSVSVFSDQVEAKTAENTSTRFAHVDGGAPAPAVKAEVDQAQDGVSPPPGFKAHGDAPAVKVEVDQHRVSPPPGFKAHGDTQAVKAEVYRHRVSPPPGFEAHANGVKIKMEVADV